MRLVAMCFFTASFLTVGFAGCSSDTGSSSSGDADTTTTTSTDGGDTAGDTDGGDTTGGTDGIDWNGMSFQEKQGHMAGVVMPAMQAIFQEFDDGTFSSFNCGTCHVTGMGAGTFAMPDPGLTPLDPANFPSAEDPDQHIATYAQLMFGAVLPEMTELLNLPPFDQATGQGFGCFSCHTAKQ
jgi:hypothetical protein